MPSVANMVDTGSGGGGGGDDAYAPGTLIWIRSEEEVWQAAEVLSSSKTELIVKLETSNEQIVINPNKDQVYLRSRDIYTAEGSDLLLFEYSQFCVVLLYNVPLPLFHSR